MNDNMDGDVFVVLFRGVGGATQLPVAKLRDALARAGFRNVSTYINSGNAVLASETGKAQTQELVAEVVRNDLGFEKDIMLVSRSEWQRIIDDNPFPEAAGRPTTLHVFVLRDTPGQESVAALKSRAVGEGVHVSGNILYLHVPDGFSASRLPPMIDRTLKTASTARNWRTVLALGKMASETGTSE
ncbi:DUF1697 domain-containing protein [Aquamicrobium defluvii]|nr:DUF1697 domain-containing protein [Aquamicrobium defluvii]